MLFSLSLGILVGISDHELKCYYYDAVKDQPIEFHYKVLTNFNSRKMKLSKSDMTYMPDVGVSVYNDKNEELRYFQLDHTGVHEFTVAESGQIKLCLRGLNHRQRLFMFGFDLWFGGADEEAQPGGEARALLRAGALLRAVQGLEATRGPTAAGTDVERQCGLMTASYVAATAAFCALHVAVTAAHVWGVKRHLRRRKI